MLSILRCTYVCSLILITSFSYGQSSQEIVEIKNQAKITLDAYINYLSYIGDKSEDFADRNQSYRKAFYQSFYSESDATLCYNDLDPEEKTSVYSSVKDYTDHVLHWYNQGLSTRFIGDYKFGQVATENGINYIPVFVKKELRGNYMERRLHNKQYDLEFRLTYNRSSLGSISNVKIASIKPASGGNSNNSVSAEELYRQAKQFYDQEEYTKALPLMRQAAEKGNVDAQVYIGIMYHMGFGVIKDATEAVKWFRKAAEQENIIGQFSLGYMYYTGEGVRPDYTEAVKWFRKAAEQNDALAQYILGGMYENGHGVTKNISTAIEWYRKAAKQNNETAQEALVRLEGTKGSDNSSISAQDLFKQAKQLYDQKEYTKALPLMKQAAEKGNVDAKVYIGYMYHTGEGVTQDYTEAVKWYRQAAEQNDALAQYILGGMYENGYGVTKNISKAIEWYRKSAKQNNETAQKALIRLEDNKGNDNSSILVQDLFKQAKQLYDQKEYTKALPLMKQAAEKGNIAAQAYTGIMYHSGYGVIKDYTEAVKWYRKAAEQNDAPTQYILGYMYENGYGVTKSISTAVEWYRKAAKQNHEGAQKVLKKLGYNW